MKHTSNPLLIVRSPITQGLHWISIFLSVHHRRIFIPFRPWLNVIQNWHRIGEKRGEFRLLLKYLALAANCFRFSALITVKLSGSLHFRPTSTSSHSPLSGSFHFQLPYKQSLFLHSSFYVSISSFIFHVSIPLLTALLWGLDWRFCLAEFVLVGSLVEYFSW